MSEINYGIFIHNYLNFGFIFVSSILLHNNENHQTLGEILTLGIVIPITNTQTGIGMLVQTFQWHTRESISAVLAKMPQVELSL